MSCMQVKITLASAVIGCTIIDNTLPHIEDIWCHNGQFFKSVSLMLSSTQKGKQKTIKSISKTSLCHCINSWCAMSGNLHAILNILPQERLRAELLKSRKKKDTL